MGNAHIEVETKEKLLLYMKENGYRSTSRGIDGLLSEHKELLVTRRENELLRRLNDEIIGK
ncbi:MAG: hypothetical protein ACXQTR_01895 [Candidatus Methanospirareceae archaeon]